MVFPGSSVAKYTNDSCTLGAEKLQNQKLLTLASQNGLLDPIKYELVGRPAWLTME